MNNNVYYRSLRFWWYCV